MMAERNEKILAELLKYPGNNVCADCGAPSEWILQERLILSVTGMQSTLSYNL